MTETFHPYKLDETDGGEWEVSEIIIVQRSITDHMPGGQNSKF